MNATTTLGLSNSDWIALSSAVVALCALGVSLWQGHLARRHSHLSVRPHLDLVFDVSTSAPSTITLHNGGLGPALIRELTIRLGERSVRVQTDDDYQVLVEYLKCHTSGCRFSHAVLDQSTVLSPGSSITLFQARAGDNADALFSAFNQLAHSIEIHVHYKCLYGNSFKSSCVPAKRVA